MTIKTETAIDIDAQIRGTIKKLLSSEEPLTLVGGGRAEEKVVLPESFKPLLKQIVAEIDKGNEVAVLAKDAEMTTQEAADYLKVSRAYLVKVIDRGEIPSRLIGNHRRVKVKDVLLYEQSLNERKRGRAVTPPVKMRDMSKDMRWLAKHRGEYAGKWVAVYEDRLVASGDSAKDVYEASDKIGLPQTLVTFIEPPLLRRKG
jgi:excisionase family DNA binding protein